MILPDVLIGISRFGPAETQFGYFYRLTKNVLFKHIYCCAQCLSGSVSPHSVAFVSCERES